MFLFPSFKPNDDKPINYKSQYNYYYDKAFADSSLNVFHLTNNYVLVIWSSMQVLSNNKITEHL